MHKSTLSKIHITVFTVILFLYLICIANHYQSINSPSINSFIYKHLLSSGEFSAQELLSSIFWAAAFFILTFTLLKNIHSRSTTQNGIIVFYCFFFFVSAGEEASWGHHYLNYSSQLALAQINAQGETNIHNLNISALLDISQDSIFYFYFENVNRILNPLFYLASIMLFIVIPAGSEKLSKKIKFFEQYPPSSKLFIYLVSGYIFLYLISDKLILDTGTLFELSLSCAAFMYALEQYQYWNSAESFQTSVIVR